MLDYKAKSPLDAYQKAWEAIAISWDKTEMAHHLSTAVLVHYEKGAFTFQVPTQHVANVFNRHAEQMIVQHTLELYMPDDMAVSVLFVPSEKAVQP